RFLRAWTERLTLGIAQPRPSIFLMAFWLLGATDLACRTRLRFPDLLFTRWPGGVVRILRRRRSLPVPVTRNRFFAALCVFCFGIVFLHSRVLRRPQDHHHVAAVEEWRGLHLPDLLHVLRQPPQQATPPFPVVRLPAAEHARHLDL